MNFEKYSDASALATYEHFLYQYLSGMTAPKSQLSKVSTPYAYGRSCVIIRASLVKKEISEQELSGVEEKSIELVIYASKKDYYDHLKKLVDQIVWESKI